jgi:hypothetical protein
MKKYVRETPCLASLSLNTHKTCKLIQFLELFVAIICKTIQKPRILKNLE